VNWLWGGGGIAVFLFGGGERMQQGCKNKVAWFDCLVIKDNIFALLTLAYGKEKRSYC
jgi:hypothetical protein